MNNSRKNFARDVLLLFNLFRDEKEFPSGFPLIYQNKLQEEESQDVGNTIKIKFMPYSDLVDLLKT